MREYDVFCLTENLYPGLLPDLELEAAKVAQKFRPSYVKFVKEFNRIALKPNSI
jgi:hypothetical protein